jgi:hypothetical protein
MTPDPRHDRLDPRRALLHPVWWCALALMALNDHVWKSGGVLPGLVTGKLSDFSGLLVAPAALAVLVGARSRLQLATLHLAVGVWFAAMNLHAPFAATWAELTRWLPFTPWRPIVDSEDPIALPMLCVSWRVLVPAMAREPGLRLRWREALQVAALGIGATFLLASEPAEPDNFGVP